MSSKSLLKEYNELREERTKYNDFVEDSLNYIATVKNEQTDINHTKVVKFITMSMTTMSNAYYKQSTFLDTQDIEQIKAALNNYIKADLAACPFKKEIMEDLTNIQNNIKEKHIERLQELQTEKTNCNKRIRVLEFAKNKLIMARLSKIQWPYDNKTQGYETEIQKLTIKAEKCEQKYEELNKKRPLANEKDILIYQMNLKEKYCD